MNPALAVHKRDKGRKSGKLCNLTMGFVTIIAKHDSEITCARCLDRMSRIKKEEQSLPQYWNDLSVSIKMNKR